MNIIKEAIANVFPKTDANAITMQTKLCEIDEWDSMNAVNLVAELEGVSGCKNLQLDFDTETTVGDIVEGLRMQGIEV